MPKNLKVKTDFEANDKMSRPISRTTRNLKRMGAVAGRVGKVLKRLGRGMLTVGRFAGGILKTGIIGLTAVATAGFLAINKMADSMDTLAKTARSIDFPIEDFQEWRFVAEQSGVKTATFDKSMQKFTKTVGEAKGGYGALFTALNKNNKPLLEQLKNTDNVSDALAIYMKAINESGGATEKAALSAAGFGRSGIDMINIANLTADEIKNLRNEMQQNGVVTAEQAAQAEEYNDMMNRVKHTLVGLMRGVLGPLMPKMTELADKFRVLILNNKELIKQKIFSFFDKVKDSVVALYNLILNNRVSIVNAWNSITESAKDLYNWVIQNKQAFILLWEASKKVVQIGFSIIKFFVETKGSIIALITAWGTFKILMFANQMKDLAIATAGVGSAAGGSVSRIASMTGALSKALGAVGLLIAAYQALKFATDQYFAAQAAKTAKENASTDRQRKLAGTDLSKLSNNALSANYKLNRNRMAELEGKKAGENFLFGGLSIEEDAELEGMQGNFRDMQKEIARRGAGGEINKSEITIKDETGRAEQTKGKKSKDLKLVSTGAMI